MRRTNITQGSPATKLTHSRSISFKSARAKFEQMASRDNRVNSPTRRSDPAFLGDKGYRPSPLSPSSSSSVLNVNQDPGGPGRRVNRAAIVDNDRMNADVDPVATSAEYELDKRIEKMDIFTVDLKKGQDGLGFAITEFEVQGIEPEVNSVIQNRGIFVTKVVEGGAADRESSIHVYDQIISVNGFSLLGVSHVYATSVLRKTSGVVHFIIGRERDPENSQVAQLLRNDIAPGQVSNQRIDDIHPVVASAEYDKRVEKINTFAVDLKMGPDGFGFRIGFGSEVDTVLEKHGIFITSITEGGAADMDSRIHVYDKIIEVNGVSLVGVTQAQAKSVLRNTFKGIVHFIIGREKDPENSKVAQLIRKTLQDYQSGGVTYQPRVGADNYLVPIRRTTNPANFGYSQDRQHPTNFRYSHDRLQSTNLRQSQDRPQTTNLGHSQDRPQTTNLGHSQDRPQTTNLGHSQDRPQTTNLGHSQDRPQTTNLGHSQDRPQTTNLGHSQARPQSTNLGHNQDRPQTTNLGQSQDRPQSTNLGHSQDCPQTTNLGQSPNRPRPTNLGYSEDRPQPTNLGDSHVQERFSSITLSHEKEEPGLDIRGWDGSMKDTPPSPWSPGEVLPRGPSTSGRPINATKDIKIKDNGRKKLLIIGQTGSGKSSICNVLSGEKHNATLFPTSADPTSCTQKTKFENVNFCGDSSRSITVIDTIGFDDPSTDHDAEIIAELITTLQANVNHVNLFLIAVNGQNPRLDGSLLAMLTIFQGMFSEKFWDQVAVVFTHLQMSRDQIDRREKCGGSDHARATKYMAEVDKKFGGKGRTLKFFLIDSMYEARNYEESSVFNLQRDELYNLLVNMNGLSTNMMKQVATENQKLKEKIERMAIENKQEIEKVSTLNEQKRERREREHQKLIMILEDKHVLEKIITAKGAIDDKKKSVARSIHDLADRIDYISRRSTAGKIIASSGGIAGVAIATTGAALTATGVGAVIGIPLIVGGATIGAVGGGTGAVNSWYKAISTSKEKVNADKELEEYELYSEEKSNFIEEYLKKLPIDTIENYELEISPNDRAWLIESIQTFKNCIKVKRSSMAVEGLKVLGGVTKTAFVLWDVAIIVKSVNNLYQKVPSEAVKSLRNIAEKLVVEGVNKIKEGTTSAALGRMCGDGDNQWKQAEYGAALQEKVNEETTDVVHTYEYMEF